MNYGFSSPQAVIFPPMVVVSVTNTCNYSCPHCFYPEYVEKPDYKRHNMSEAVFRKIADEMKAYPESILRLIAWGEPLLHPKIVDFVRYMRNVGAGNKITVITNGSLLFPTMSLALMKSGLDLVEVSLDAAAEQTYTKRRRCGIRDAFRKVESNVCAMVDQRDRQNLHTRIVVSYIVWPYADSEREFEVFSSRWRGVVDDVVRRPLHTFKGTLREHRPLPEVRPPCYGMWARCDITPWGEVSVCYNDWEREDILGDLKCEGVSIKGVWQGKALQVLREGQKEGRFCGMCKKCKDYNPTAWVHPYEKVIARCLDSPQPE